MPLKRKRAPDDQDEMERGSKARLLAEDKICWNFVRGKCYLGRRCRFTHLNDNEAKAAAKRSMMRAGKAFMVGNNSEAASQLESLFRTWEKKGTRPSEKQQQAWQARCTFSPGESSDVKVLKVMMRGTNLGTDGMYAWAYWLSEQLVSLDEGVKLQVPMIDLSSNSLGSESIRVLCLLLEKHAVHCKEIKLDDNQIGDDELKHTAYCKGFLILANICNTPKTWCTAPFSFVGLMPRHIAAVFRNSTGLLLRTARTRHI